jgi:hypothetical protein
LLTSDRKHFRQITGVPVNRGTVSGLGIGEQNGNGGWGRRMKQSA